MPPTIVTIQQWEIPKLERDPFQCQYCYVSETEKPLRVCSGCQRAHYCTTECQTKDWKMHKKMCKIKTESRKHYKEPQKLSDVKAAFGLTPSKLEAKTKRWVQFYKPLLLASVKHALKLQTEEPLQGHCLYFHLVPKFTAANVPRTDDDLINAFKAEKISVRSISALITEGPNLKSLFDSVAEKEKDLIKQEGQDHIMCIATVVIHVPAIDTTRFVPFGVSKESMRPWNPLWKEDLERGIEKAAPTGCRVCLHI